MATLYATVFRSAGAVASGDPSQEFPTPIAGTSTPSTVAVMAVDEPKKRRYVVRILADEDCFLNWGEGTPVATADGNGGRAISAGVAEYFYVQAGHKLATIQRT